MNYCVHIRIMYERAAIYLGVSGYQGARPVVVSFFSFDSAKILYTIIKNQTKKEEILYNIFYLTIKY